MDVQKLGRGPTKSLRPESDGFFSSTACAAIEGQLDDTFSSNGNALYAIDDIAAGQDIASTALVAPDGSHYIIGSADGSNGLKQIAIVRTRPSGQRDGTFGQGGIAVTAFGGAGQRYANKAIFDSFGHIVVANTFESGGGNKFLSMCRFNAQTGATQTWGNAPCSSLDINAVPLGNDVVNDIVLAPDGKIYLIGTAELAAGRMGVIARFTANGQLDLSYSGDGISLILLSAEIQLRAGAVFPDGNLVTCGSSRLTLDQDQDIFIMRTTALGSLDSTFSGDGRVTFAINAGASTDTQDDVCRDIGIGKNGTTIFAGTVERTSSKRTGIVGFLSASGVVQQSFSTLNFGVDLDLNSLVVTSDGKAVVSGTIDLINLSDKRGFVQRLLANGNGDPAFNGGNWQQINQNPGTGFTDGEVYNAVVLAAGKPLIVGAYQYSAVDWDFSATRLYADLIFADGL